jgi:hypothetical protein
MGVSAGATRRSAGHSVARFRAAATDFRASSHQLVVTELGATVGTDAADFSTNGAGAWMRVRAEQHETRARATNLRALREQLDMPCFRMPATEFQAV